MHFGDLWGGYNKVLDFSFRTPPPLAHNQARDSASPTWPGWGLVPKMHLHSLEFFLQSYCS